MLSNHALSTPRPRPPAKMRRDASLPFHPPPPYAPRMDMILDSSLDASAHGGGSPPQEAGMLNAPTMEEWIQERSREELSDLLVAAEDIIKTRENELGLTSALCKNLYQENVQLKSRHDALLARLPVQGPSPLPSPTRSLSPLPPGSPHYYSVSRPHSPIANSSARLQHARRISVTPSELSLLADQNAELLDKLQKLEEESAHADLAGKRKLRKLEREISGLREELDKTRAKGAELEAKAYNVLALSEDEAERRKKEKEERAERTKALRDRMSGMSSANSSDGSVLEEPVRDFAPPSELPSVKNYASPVQSPAALLLNLTVKPTTPLPLALPTLPPTAKLTSPVSEPLPALTSGSESGSSRPASRLRPDQPLPPGTSERHSQDGVQGAAPPTLEYEIISQLLSKIRELEETNAQINADQKATAQKLQDVHWDAESIKRAYDCLVDEEREVHMISEDEADDEAEAEGSKAESSHAPSSVAGTVGVKSNAIRKREPTGETIRFSSLRRTIDGDISRESMSSGVFSAPTSPDKDQIDIDFAQGIMKEMQSTARSRMAALPTSHGHRTRKSVMGLFDGVEVANPADDEPSADADAGSYPRALSVSPAFLAKNDPSEVSAWSTDATDGQRFPSLSPSTSTYPSPAHSPSPSTQFLNAGSARRNPHTLGSEIGTEDWPAEENGRGWNYHLRTSSLCDLTGLGSVESMEANGGGGSTHAASPIRESRAESAPTASSSLAPPAREPSPPSSGWEDVSDDNEEGVGLGIVMNRSARSVKSAGSATPTKGPLGRSSGLQLQLVVEPPTPSPNKLLRTSRSAHSLRVPIHPSTSTGLLGEAGVRDSRTSRNARLSQTVRARTSRWVEKVERRYAFDADEPLQLQQDTPTRSQSLRKRKSLGLVRGHPHNSAHTQARRISSAIDDTFDEVLVQFSRSNLAISALASRNDRQDPDVSLVSCDDEAENDVSLSAEVMAARPRREGFVGLLLEVWLWLQFAVVVMVFLWAMARRGPKSVLEDAERRRSVVRRSAST